MRDGAEYGSLTDVATAGIDLVAEMRRALKELAVARQRPNLIYAGNIARPSLDPPSSIVASDDLPFSELIASIPASSSAVDIVLATGGGSGQTVALFVERLRRRFTDVHFIIPSAAMSAGTMFAMSGNEVWMGPQAYLGPIDPQVPSRDGRLVPYQTLLLLLDEIQQRGQQRLAAGQPLLWSDVELIRQLDPKQLGEAMALSKYSIELVQRYLEQYKFQHWTTHSTDGRPVTDDEKRARAHEIAHRLGRHADWNTHGHGITREELASTLKLRIRHTEEDAATDRALRRLWALVYWCFEAAPLAKIFLSLEYALLRIKSQGAR